MKLVLVITKQDEHGKNIEATRTAHEFPECRAVAGSVENADLKLDGLAELSFVIDRDPDDRLVIIRKDPSLRIHMDGEDLIVHEHPIRNGDVFLINDYEVFVCAEFDRAPQNPRGNWVTLTTVVLMIAIFFFEIGVLTWLPRQIRRRELWGSEVLRQETIHLLDQVRGSVKHMASKENEQRPLLKGTANLYKVETDRMAQYLRKHQHHMTVEQLMRFKQDLDRLHEQIGLLAQGKLVPPARKLEIDRVIEQEISEPKGTQ
ncbi:hypothetical protein BVY04_05150 [bacterium M21]|nr:hypothetical protein BVY04_05150 [bacterium M21]